MAHWKRLAFAKWDKCMEGNSLAVNSLFQEACQFQWHELDWNQQQVGYKQARLIVKSNFR